MATAQPLVAPLSLIAGADLSALQFTFVTLNSSGQVVGVTAEGGDAIGVLLNKPTSGQAAEVHPMVGIQKVVAGADLTPGTKVKSDATGKAILATAASTDHVLGTLVGDPGASGEIVEVLLGSQHILA